jgi:hypothetical protein
VVAAVATMVKMVVVMVVVVMVVMVVVVVNVRVWVKQIGAPHNASAPGISVFFLDLSARWKSHPPVDRLVALRTKRGCKTRGSHENRRGS